VRAKRPSKHGVRVAGRNEPHQNRAPRDVIRHMVAGSVASTHHGEPRTTQDIDLVIDADASQLLALVGQFDPERYYLSDPAAALGAGGQFNLIEPATGWKVDFILRRDRPFSRSEFDRRCPVTLFGVQTAVATAEDTILAKLEWPSRGNRTASAEMWFRCSACNGATSTSTTSTAGPRSSGSSPSSSRRFGSRRSRPPVH
jgi:hypothetical protein